MNVSYRLAWSLPRRALVPVPEFARRACKAAGPRILGAAILAGLSCAAQALPTGGQAVSGTAAISQAGSVLTVTNSANAIVNWRKFAIDAGETVKFLQSSASSAVLNRVVGSDPSTIYGLLQSNGKVWLVNPAGILIGPTGRIDTAGFVASTLGISNENFLAGRLLFRQGATPSGSVVNQGVIGTPSGGQIYLVGPEVRNEGSLSAPNGEVLLAAGQSVQLGDTGTPGVSVEVTGNGTATNLGSILAEAGRIGIAGLLVRNAGTLNASSVVREGGRIFLRAGQDVTLADGSAIEANGTKGGSVSILTQDADGRIAGTATARGSISARGDGSAGSGGLVETSAAKLDLNGATVNTNGGTWLIDPVDFTIAASGGDISGTALAAQLDANNVTILSSNGVTAGVGDIDVNDAVGWNSAHGLTLSALHSVNVNQPIGNAGSGGLTLRADNTGACFAGAGNCGTVAFAGAGHVTLNGGALKIYYNPVGSNAAADANGNGPSYAAPTDYSANLTLNNGSTATAWMLVNDVNQLQAMSTNLGGHYALGRDIDASATAGWNGGAGFAPVGAYSTPFGGSFDGGGHAVSGLVIHRPDTDAAVGLFGASTGNLVDASLVDVDVVGNQNVGALAGWSWGTVSDSNSSGKVTGNSSVGGLVGGNAADIVDSYATGTVDGEETSGGLVAFNAGNIIRSHASGTVNAPVYGGGLVGLNSGSISESYATGNVNGGDDIGGLVGSNGGTISLSYATGDVVSRGGNPYGVGNGDQVGGLVGINSGTVTMSHATGNVSSLYGRYVGGLVGLNVAGESHPTPTGVQEQPGIISDSYATGSVSGVDSVGGLVGGNVESLPGLVRSNDGRASVVNSYATGAVLGDGSVGGLVGWNNGSIVHSHATGDVGGRGTLGGLVGHNETGIYGSYATGNVSGSATAGGLVGENGPNGIVSNSYAAGDVYGLYGAGGLVGTNAGLIENAYATGSVNSQEDGSYSGGLVGYNSGTVIDAYAKGDVISWNAAGGLVGINAGSVTNAYATGNVRGYKGPAGGLAGSNSGTILVAYATGQVTGSRSSNGGLVGFNSGALSEVFATGDVIGKSFAAASEYNGGLVGYNSGTIRNAFATGSVSTAPGTTANYNAGLVAYNTGAIIHAYSTGAVSGARHNGGLVAFNSGTVIGGYWDIATSGQKTSAAGTGLKHPKMRLRKSFAGFDFANVWTIRQGRGYPQLQAFYRIRSGVPLPHLE